MDKDVKDITEQKIAKVPAFIGWRKMIFALVVFLVCAHLLSKQSLPASVFGDITISLVVTALGSNVLSKFAGVLENKRYGKDDSTS